jgi:hypothetical protein
MRLPSLQKSVSIFTPKEGLWDRLQVPGENNRTENFIYYFISLYIFENKGQGVPWKMEGTQMMKLGEMANL